jgi:hypothetical protein
MSEVKVDSLVSAYLSLRREREKLAKKYEQEDSVFKEQMDRLEEAMLNTCNDIGAETTGITLRNSLWKMKHLSYYNNA